MMNKLNLCLTVFVFVFYGVVQAQVGNAKSNRLLSAQKEAIDLRKLMADTLKKNVVFNNFVGEDSIETTLGIMRLDEKHKAILQKNNINPDFRIWLETAKAMDTIYNVDRYGVLSSILIFDQHAPEAGMIIREIVDILPYNEERFSREGSVAKMLQKKAMEIIRYFY